MQTSNLEQARFEFNNAQKLYKREVRALRRLTENIPRESTENIPKIRKTDNPNYNKEYYQKQKANRTDEIVAKQKEYQRIYREKLKNRRNSNIQPDTSISPN